MSRRTLFLGGAGLVGLVLTFAGLAPAGDPVLDPDDPPVRLKKKEKPRPEPAPEKKKEPEKKKAQDEDKSVIGKEIPDRPDGPKGEAKKPARPQPNRAAEERKKLIVRVQKNMEAAETRLAKKNAGKGTQDIQRRVLEDLDKLIEQTQKQPPPQSSSSSRSGRKLSRRMSNSRNSRGGRNSQQSGSRNSQRPNQGGGSKGQKNANQGGGPKNQQGGGGGPKKNGQGGGGAKGAKSPAQGGGGNGPHNKQDHRTEIFKDIWGELPEALRMEMDAYSRAKFVPEYDSMLRRYYQTISEQGRRKKGE